MHICMRTTLDIDDQLLRAARKRAASEQTTLTAVIEMALAALLAHRPEQQAAFKLHVETDRGRYLGGFDIANRTALYDVMDDRL